LPVLHPLDGLVMLIQLLLLTTPQDALDVLGFTVTVADPVPPELETLAEAEVRANPAMVKDWVTGLAPS
jgi:hypothetical protein